MKKKLILWLLSKVASKETVWITDFRYSGNQSSAYWEEHKATTECAMYPSLKPAKRQALILE